MKREPSFRGDSSRGRRFPAARAVRGVPSWFAAFGLIVLLMLGATSCGVDVPVEQEGFPCNPDGSCDHGLVCVDDVCVFDSCPEEGCGAGFVCLDGECVEMCLVGGEARDPGERAPHNDCLLCDPSRDTGDWTFAPAGTACGNGDQCDGQGMCVSDDCEEDCSALDGWVDVGAPYACCDGLDSCDDCQDQEYRAYACLEMVCEYTVTEDRTDKRGCSTCDDGNDCTSNSCEGGACVTDNRPSGTPCGSSGQCDAEGRCSEGCIIGGESYSDGETDPSNPCRYCDVGTSNSSWTDVTSGTTCGSTEHGSWSSCSYPDACSNSGTRTRTVTEYTCESGSCTASTSTETDSSGCSRNTNGDTCDSTSYGSWSSCSYPDACSNSGTRTRTVTTYTCLSGSCAASTSTETDSSGCSRDTSGDTCDSTGYGSWSSCSYPDVCSNSGTRTRTVTEFTCSNQQCMASSWTQINSSGCTRDTEGNSCGSPIYGSWTCAVYLSPPQCILNYECRNVTHRVCMSGSCDYFDEQECQYTSGCTYCPPECGQCLN